MKNRKRWLALGLFVAVLGLIGYAGWRHFYGLPPGINRDGFEQIQVGMTRPEVEAILGEPPMQLDPGGNAWWCMDNGGVFVLVRFNQNGKVEDKDFSDEGALSLLDRIWLKIGW